MKKTDAVSSPKVQKTSTKEQIFAAYSEVLDRLNDKQEESPQEAQKKQEEKTIVTKSAAHSPEQILSDLSGLKLKSIKQLDVLSEELLQEFQKLSEIRQAIASEQCHLEDLYLIKDTANTLAALLQTHAEQKEQLQQTREQQKQEYEEFMNTKRAQWNEENERYAQDFREKKEKWEKDRKREEEDYAYTREMQRRKEMDDYNTKKTNLEKELVSMKEDLQKREELVHEKEKLLTDLQDKVAQFPIEIAQAVATAEAQLRTQLMQQYDFESQIKQKELEGLTKFHNLQVTSLQGKIKEQEALIKDLSQKSDQATENVQKIACRALDTSAQRFMAASASSANSEDKVGNFQKS